MGVRGSDDFTRLVDYDLTWRDDARRFEFITLPFQDFAGMNASLELFHELGPREVAAHITCSPTRSCSGPSEHGVELVTPSDAGTARRDHRRASAGRARGERGCARRGVAHSFREGAIRLSPHVYNTSAEIDYALNMIAP